jgi:hypothetical protein
VFDLRRWSRPEAFPGFRVHPTGDWGRSAHYAVQSWSLAGGCHRLPFEDPTGRAGHPSAALKASR